MRIVDDVSGEDITRALLLQIISDQERGGRPMLDAELLMRIIRLYGNPMQDFLGEYLLRSLEAFMAQQNRFQEQVRAALAATPLATMQEVLADNMKAWQRMQEKMLGLEPDEDKDPE